MSIITSFTSYEYGITAVVSQHKEIYQVRLLDDESGNFVPIIHNFLNLDDAIRYGKGLVTPDPGPVTMCIL